MSKLQFGQSDSLMVTPRKKIGRQIVKHLKEYGLADPDPMALIQGEEDVETFLERHLTEAQRRDIADGWEVEITIDPWDFGHYVGYDFHEAIKP